MSYPPIFTYTITVTQSAIDEYGHVNNVIYVQWMQDAAIRHGESIPEYKPPENTGWYAREHRIEYLAPAYLGDEIEVRTWASEMKRVRALRKYEFIRKANGKVIAKGETQWIFVELTTGRPIAIPPEIQALFPVLPDQTNSAASVS
jgi:acyl-CoA thioester hydrolase